MKIIRTVSWMIALTGGMLLLPTTRLSAQLICTLDASHVNTTIRSGYFKMGQPGPEGKQLLVNSRYLTISGTPQIPVMGELQFSRMPKERWEDEILKMKAAGVTVIATYLFWNHHEEIEGQFDWTGNKDIRSFVQLCSSLGLLVYPRLGPWSHGEARNGGTPDWILRKTYLTDRSLDPVYQSYVEKYFRQIGRQLKGLMYKDGGPIVGVQLENEYWKGKAGEPYISWLKQTALKNGIDVPLYTVTGWGDGSVPKDEVIPLWGGYPDESWNPNIEKITGCDNYRFQPFRDDPTIGNEQVKKKEGYDYSLDPYFTCEMGVGIFNSIQRRPIIGALDGLAMILSRIGSGGNLLGYYIFAGGSNPLGLYSTMEENKDETGYWSELSPISYDFQAAIRENGLPAPSYYEVKGLNYFLDEFGHLLAPMEPAFAAPPSTLQYAVRTKDNSGFLFGINYCRNNQRPLQHQAKFRIRLKTATINFPEEPIDIPDSSLFIWPLNFDLGSAVSRSPRYLALPSQDTIPQNPSPNPLLIYATARPFFHTTLQGQSVWVFTQDADVLPEFCFEETSIEKVETTDSNSHLVKKDHRFILSHLHPGRECVMTITGRNGTTQKILLLSRKEAKEAWLLKDAKSTTHLFLSRTTLYMKGNQLYLTDTLPDLKVMQLVNKTGELFTTVTKHFPVRKLSCTPTPKGALADAQWLTTSVKSIDPSTLLYHREFQKEFSSGDPAKIRSAKLILAPESECRFRINDKWVDQTIQTNNLNVLDITGYVQKGDNVLLMDFPYTTGDKAFAARVLIEYFNTDRLDFSTDTSWLSTDLYYFPATYGSKPVYPLGFTTPKPTSNTAGNRSRLSNSDLPGFRSWALPIPCDYREGLNNVYLAADYTGDRIAVRCNGKLIADELNNNTRWLMNCRRGEDQLACQELQIEIRPWKHLDKIYFDKPPALSDENRASLEEVRLIPEYQTSIQIAD